MRVIILFCLINYVTVFSCLSQDSNFKSDKTTLYYKVKLTNIRFSVGDTVIPYSLLVEPSGKIDFEEGYDFSYHKFDFARYRIEGKSKSQKTYKDTIIATKDRPIDLTSYFPPLNQDSTKFINGYKTDFHWSPHFEYEIKYSYILNGVSALKLFQSERDSTIRIIAPEEGGEGEIHSIYEIDLKKIPLEIKYFKTKHNYNGSFTIMEQGTSYVRKQKEITNLFTELNKYSFNKDNYFINVGGAIQYLVEFKTTNEYYALMRRLNDNWAGDSPETYFPLVVKNLYKKNLK